MIDDILSMPEIFEIDGKEYKAEFDCRSYAILESMTGKSVYRIQDLIADNNLFLMDSIEVVCASLIKNHTEAEIKEVREKLTLSPCLLVQINMPVITSFFKGIAPPEIFKRVLELQGKIKDIDKKKEKKIKV